MTVYEIKHADWELASQLAKVMRKADVDEVWAAAHQTPSEALASSLAMSRDSMAGLVDGRVACLFGTGVCTALSLRGVPWLLASDELVRHARPFLRASRAYVRQIKQEYRHLENYVDARNTEAVKWLGWLGFKIEPATPFGMERLPFHRFSWEAPRVLD